MKTLLRIKMMALAVVILSVLTSTGAEQTDDLAGKKGSILRVPAGQTFTVTPDKSLMVVENWIMEPNSKITFTESVSSWKIIAMRASFADNSTIDARGKNGQNGGNGSKAQGQPGHGKKGHTGGRGQDGTEGTDGVDLSLQFGIASLTDLIILVDGGKGGKGGDGGKGGKGGGYKLTAIGDAIPGGDGGRGGRGGNAGNGGDSSDVDIVMWPLRDAQLKASSAAKGQGLRILGEPGKPGKPGLGGPGHKGHRGHTISKDFGITWRRSVPGGAHGAKGPTGVKGISGSKGKQAVRFVAAPPTINWE